MTTLEKLHDQAFHEFLDARQQSGQIPLSPDEFYTLLEKWYHEFQSSNVTLGYVATQLGITKIDLIALLDMLGWKVTNL